MVDARRSALFTKNNYKFSTKRGDRLSSFYFQDSRGNKGRLRRQHRDGPLVVYQGLSLWLFISPTAMDTFNPSKVRQYYTAQNRREQGFSLAPVEGWNVVEIIPPSTFAHGSSGSVIRDDPAITEFDFAAFHLDDNWEESSWTESEPRLLS